MSYKNAQTSSTEDFVAATRAQLAIIPVGLSSPFGHPRPEIVERWRSTGAQVMTTGERGTITVSTDGHDITVASYK